MPDTDNPGAGTPSVRVRDNRGRKVRRIDYNRARAGDAPDERIERHDYDACGHPASGIDARLFSLAGSVPNFLYVCSLGGVPLRTLSVDAGTRHLLADIAQRVVWQRDGRGVVQRHDYDALGRRCARREQWPGAAEEACERLVYGERIEGAADRNLRDRLVRHYDGAGLLDLGRRGYSLYGEPLRQQRQLLPPGAAAVWAGSDESVWRAALEPTIYPTVWRYDACGQVSGLCDAMGHRRRYARDVRGLGTAVWMQLLDGVEQQVRVSVARDAAGRRQREIAGNGVSVIRDYDPPTRRLRSLQTVGADGTTLLQDFGYVYDPAGNPVGFRDGGRETRQYAYDALYQLVCASGSENVAVTPSPVDNPDAFVPEAAATYGPYRRDYDYDRGGNLLQIRHLGTSIYVRTLAVSPRSNRAVVVSGNTPADVDAGFDGCGNLLQLDTGRQLVWNGLSQLQQWIAPDGTVESFCHGGDRLCVRKTRILASGGQEDVIYLPGLTLHTTRNGQSLIEALQVLATDEAGSNPVRLLNWTAGQPEDGINGQLRYSFDDYQGSSLLELDAAGTVLTRESYYPYGGTAMRAAGSAREAACKAMRYSGKERDTGSELYDYGLRQYPPWLGRWLNPDPAGTVDGLNLYRMVRNNPVRWRDGFGSAPGDLLEENFSAGDVLFGLRKPVKAWISGNRARLKAPGGEDIDKVMQDDLTDRVWSPLNPRQYRDDEEIMGLFASDEGAGEGVLYKYFLVRHARYNVIAFDGLSWYEAFRKLSKAGLEFHMKMGQTVHFMMDDMIAHLAEVAAKQGTPKAAIQGRTAPGPGTSITSSELRWLYRNRHTASVQEQVRFYLKGREVSHAEVFDRPEWRAYRPRKVLPQGFRY